MQLPTTSWDGVDPALGRISLSEWANVWLRAVRPAQAQDHLVVCEPHQLQADADYRRVPDRSSRAPWTFRAGSTRCTGTRSQPAASGRRTRWRIDRENDRYDEVVADPETGDIIHGTHEPWSLQEATGRLGPGQPPRGCRSSTPCSKTWQRR